MHVIASLQRLAALPADQRKLMLEAALALVLADLALRGFGFVRGRTWMSRLAGFLGAEPSLTWTQNDLVRSAWAVRAVARRLPGRLECLPQALALWWMLLRRGLDAKLCFGVRPLNHGFGAHAWVELDGVPIGGIDGDFRKFRGTLTSSRTSACRPTAPAARGDGGPVPVSAISAYVRCSTRSDHRATAEPRGRLPEDVDTPWGMPDGTPADGLRCTQLGRARPSNVADHERPA